MHVVCICMPCSPSTFPFCQYVSDCQFVASVLRSFVDDVHECVCVHPCMKHLFFLCIMLRTVLIFCAFFVRVCEQFKKHLLQVTTFSGVTATAVSLFFFSLSLSSFLLFFFFSRKASFSAVLS